ncbi:MAG: F0F1 ATP synthase subunit A [Anaerolineales bacterium]|nr:F0F1 ATP synthase subunit A [Anaerolineales bacterium]
MEQTRDQPKKINRWIFLVILVLSFVAAGAYAPVMPHVQLPAEKLTHEPIFGNVYLTNTIVAVLIADVLILLIAFSIRKQAKQGKNVFTGIAGVFAVILEYLSTLTESTAGKWAKKIFPWFATIMLLVLIVNWMELIPGVDSIGILEKSDHGFATQEVLPGVVTILKTDDQAEEGDHHEDRYTLVPFVRVTSTDLNFTLSLALISVVMIQVIGFQALGLGYLTKYFNVSGVKKLGKAIRKPGFGGPFDLLMPLIDIAVGILEIVAEISKILSFSFRLFGNIFAGAVLLFVIGSIVPVFAQTIFLILELGVGAIQAFVFGILTMVFMSMATQGHGDHEEAH